jgi:hypothetical protein
MHSIVSFLVRIFAVVLTCSTILASGNPEQVVLKDVKSITLIRGEWTTNKRVSAVPQV